MSASRLLTASILLCLMASSFASLYDHKRGLQTYSLGEEEVEQFLRHRDPAAQANKYAQREALVDHPEVQRFLEWKDMHLAGHPDAGAAFAGNIPHDYLPLISKHTEAA